MTAPNKKEPAKNSYHSLVEQNERLKEALKGFKSTITNSNLHPVDVLWICDEIDLLEAALKAAEGGVK